MGLAGAIWGIAGFLLLLGFAVMRLVAPAMDVFSTPMLWYHWLFLALMLLSFLYVKGYLAFQRGLSRRVVERAFSMREDPRAFRVLLAPLYCMGYFGAGSKRQWIMIGVTAAMLAFILIVRLIPEPWRGIMDLGLVLAFAWGFVATVIHSLGAAPGRRVE